VAIEVSNTSNVVHEKTTVEIIWADIASKLPSIDPSKLSVIDAKTGNELTHQIIYHGSQTPQALIFQVTLAANESANLLVKEIAPKHEPVYKTFGRYVPERLDDFAWENDRVAFRMSGPALAGTSPTSNGVDIWMKKTEKLIVDQFYDDELNNNKPYYVDHGEGLDCYRLGSTLGAGGISPFVNDSLWIGKNWITQKVLDNGPLRVAFMLTYNNLTVGNETYSKEIVISLDAGSQFNKGVVSFDGAFNDIMVAAAIRHPEIFGTFAGTTDYRENLNAGYIALSETATSSVNAVPAGRTYVATVIPDGKMTEFRYQQGHLLSIAPYKKGEKFTYYFGGGWNQWGFPTDEAWFNYVAGFAEKLKNPLKVTVK